MIKKIIISSILFNQFAMADGIPKGETIYSCGDGAGWAPYTYETPSRQVQGYDVDILEHVLSKHQLTSIVKMEPWKRCLRSTADGEQYQIALSSAFSDERNKTYLLSRPYYEITPSYFYSKSRFPRGLDVRSADDFKKYRVCGLLGYNYNNFGVQSSDVDTGTKSFGQLAEKTSRGRCDLFLARYETFIAAAKIGKDLVQEYNLGSSSIPGVDSEKFYLLISRNYRYANELKSILDREISILGKQGDLAGFLDNSIKKIDSHFPR